MKKDRPSSYVEIDHPFFGEYLNVEVEESKVEYLKVVEVEVSNEKYLQLEVEVSNEKNLNEKVELLKKKIPMSRHHVIPWFRVRNFYILMMDDVPTLLNACEILQKLMKNITGMAVDPGFKLEDFKECQIQNNIILQLINSMSSEAREKLFKNKTNIDLYCTQILTFFSWLPGNIFIGPTKRYDDPGAEFEYLSQFILPKAQYDILFEINELMKNTIREHENKTLTRYVFYQRSNRVLELLEQLKVYHQVTKFDLRQWLLYTNKNKWVIFKNSYLALPVIIGDVRAEDNL